MKIKTFFCAMWNTCSKLKSNSTAIKETLYEMDWSSLRKDTKFNIITMMIYTSKPIVISSGFVIKINISTFISIINASYSAFNVLQQMVKK
ncbi:uncharacterized protein LOC117182927 [Belonocnema kinseyi]|uniref:uncharacterized protein LOC117182927 n=1 Tax=Belonocnema kinseyi TaxID=2817044 RepID=UPI00143D2A8F|nr:uncharacterized protein LOC117182927 [Belonocnema kinseyi]